MATTNKGLEQPANGSNVDTWDQPLNLNFGYIDQAFGGNQSLNVTGISAVTLTEAQYRNLILTITGSVTGTPIYRIPSGKGGQWIVYNNTSSSAGAVTIAGPSPDAGVSVAAGTVVPVYSDGTNVRLIAQDATAIVNAAFAARSVLAGTGMTGGGNLSSNVTLTADQATSANWRQNVADKLLNANAVWSSMAEEILTDQSPVSWNLQSGFDFILTLTTAIGATRQIANPTNPKVGQKGRLILQQPASGGPCAVTWGSYFKFANGTAPTLSTTGGAIDVLYYDVRSATYIIISLAGRNFA